MTVKKRFIGKTNVEVSELGFGTAPLGGWPVEVSDKNAQSSLQKAWDLGIRYFDLLMIDNNLLLSIAIVLRKILLILSSTSINNSNACSEVSPPTTKPWLASTRTSGFSFITDRTALANLIPGII